MKNRITLLTLILCFTAIAGMAQTADIEVRYEDQLQNPVELLKTTDQLQNPVELLKTTRV